MTKQTTIVVIGALRVKDEYALHNQILEHVQSA